jgi:hypothetical protein
MPTYTRHPAPAIRAETVAQVYAEAARLGDDETLRVLARAVVRQIKRDHVLPEEMVIRVKALFPNTAVYDAGQLARRNWTTYERMIAWCIEEYFARAD